MDVSRKQNTPNFQICQHFLPPDRHDVCVSGGKKYSFFRKFGVLCFLETPILKFALLAYYQRCNVSYRFVDFTIFPNLIDPNLDLQLNVLVKWLFEFSLKTFWVQLTSFTEIPVGIWMLKVNNGNTRKMYEICLKLAINMSKLQHHLRCPGVFIVSFEQISYISLFFSLIIAEHVRLGLR